MTHMNMGRLTPGAAALSGLPAGLLAGTPADAQYGGYGWHMGPGMMNGAWGGGWGGGLFGGIFMLIIWVLIIVGLVFLVKWLIQTTSTTRNGGSPPGFSSPRALEILKERYARGEIDKAEYDEKKKDLID